MQGMQKTMRKNILKPVHNFMLKLGRVFLVACLLMLTQGVKAAPDPITFAWAIERGDIQKVSAWFAEGLDPEFQGAQIGTGLMIAAWNGNIEMMQLFLAHGANPRRANKNGEQPLQLAAWNGHSAAVEWLLENGAQINRADHNWSALHYAVFNGHKDLAKQLVSQGAAVNVRSPNGSTPLMLAAREGHEELAKMLLESGADLKAQNDWGDSALTMAMRYDHYRLGKMIATPEEFEIAVKAPKESYGEVTRSAAAPNSIEELLKKIREAEAEQRPPEEVLTLQKSLLNEVHSFRRSAVAAKNSRRAMPLPNQPKSIVITGTRSQPNRERAQINAPRAPIFTPTDQPKAPASLKANSKDSPKTSPKASSKVLRAEQERTAAKRHTTQAKIAEVLRQIRLAEAQGDSPDALRQQLSVLLDSLK